MQWIHSVQSILPWEIAVDMPWRMFTNPVDKWALQPTFVIGEYLFIVCAAFALWHAKRSGRAHVLAWIAALVAGTANDMIFMALPMVDNFWQAQGTIMITPRLPLYIPCVYVCFMYYPTVAVWRFGLRPIPRAMLTGLAAIAFYGIYDIIGAKFLWWTWHDTDPPIAERILGAPVGSTMWVITFAATFAYLLGRQVDRDPDVSRRTAARALAIVAALCTVVMVLQITVLQQLDGGVPGVIGLIAVVVVYAGFSIRGLLKAEAEPSTRQDRLANGLFAVYFGVMALLMLAFDPASHSSPSVHQTIGECGVEEKDITGLTRDKYLCLDEHDEDHFYDEDFDFACLDVPPEPMEGWYTACGRAHTQPGLYKGALVGLSAVGLGLYTFLWGGLRRRSE